MFLMIQYNTGIISCFLLLLPWLSSTCRQTNEDNAGKKFLKMVFDSQEFNRSVVLEVGFHDEEDELISSTLHDLRANILLVQHRSKFFHQYVKFLWKSRQVLFFVVLLAFNFNEYSSNCTSEVSCSLLFKL